MPNPKPLLAELTKKGKPLAEVSVIPCESEDLEAICAILDGLAPDLRAEIRPAYLQFSDPPTDYSLLVETTQEALRREFGWLLEREKIYDSAKDGGKFPDGYAWKEINTPQFFPPPLEGRISEMSLVQPGNSDNGNIDDVTYSATIENDV